MMAIIGRDPFVELTDMCRLTDSLFGGLNSKRINGTRFGEIAPTVDVYDRVGEFVIEAELPGVTEKDISVEVKDNLLTISGERKRADESKAGSYRDAERSFGKFRRSFALSDSVEVDNVNARIVNGVLTICLPKSPKALSRKIAVAAG